MKRNKAMMQDLRWLREAEAEISDRWREEVGRRGGEGRRSKGKVESEREARKESVCV